LLQEVVAMAETSMSRRKFILHYFGESFDTETGEGGDMDDNVRNPKPQTEAKEELKLMLQIVSNTHEKYKSKDLVNVITGQENALINSHRTNELPFFGKGKNHDTIYWMALVRQALVAGYLRKDIETYGVLKLTPLGQEFIEQPKSFMMTADHTYNIDSNRNYNNASDVADATLMRMLKDLRKSNAKKLEVPPYVIFQDPSLEDMALKYPITIEELYNIHGVGEGKARRYGKDFVKLIKQYVDDNEIERMEDMIIKSTGLNSSLKLYIIQNIDRKLPLDDISSAKGMEMADFIRELEAIVFSGTKLNIDYWIDELFDEDQQEEIHDYFMESESDDIESAIEEFDGEYDDQELRLYRLKFISEVAN
jgi:ATP-dependent DNA helicase RecQ